MFRPDNSRTWPILVRGQFSYVANSRTWPISYVVSGFSRTVMNSGDIGTVRLKAYTTYVHEGLLTAYSKRFDVAAADRRIHRRDDVAAGITNGDRERIAQPARLARIGGHGLEAVP